MCWVGRGGEKMQLIFTENWQTGWAVHYSQPPVLSLFYLSLPPHSALWLEREREREREDEIGGGYSRQATFRQLVLYPDCGEERRVDMCVCMLVCLPPSRSPHLSSSSSSSLPPLSPHPLVCRPAADFCLSSAGNWTATTSAASKMEPSEPCAIWRYCESPSCLLCGVLSSLFTSAVPSSNSVFVFLDYSRRTNCVALRTCGA